MDFIPVEIERYSAAHSDPEPELLHRLHRETWQKVIMPRMLSGHFQGRLLSFISRLKSPQRILEIGAYTGYSAICLCEGLQPGGRLDTIEVNPELTYLQDKYWAEAGLTDCINRYIGKAIDILPTLEGPYDIVFIDADKENYPAYYELALERTRPGGLLLIDNVLWSGKVTTEAAPNDRETRILQELNDFIARDPRVSKVMLPIRDGVFAILRQ